MKKRTIHEQYMRRALALAKRAEGRTSPNPMVGAVIVRDGEIVGEGFTQPAGHDHAEIVALKQAGGRAKNATAYVTLEPCSHHGRTPPCSKALINAGISTLYYAVSDPNPRVNGTGCQHLRDAGVAVHNSLCHAEAKALNRPFFKYIQHGLPFVTAKFGMSLDGKIATQTGESQWITNATSRAHGHQLRNVSDAILVGANTVIADNPRLTTRLDDLSDGDTVTHPVRIVADSRGRVPLTSKIFSAELPGRTILATTEQAPRETVQQLEQMGVTVWVLPTDKNGRVDLMALLGMAADNELVNVMVEGGGTLLGSLLTLGQIDRVWAFIAPIIIGGATSPTPFSGNGIEKLAEAPRLMNIKTTNLDGDIWIEGDVERVNNTSRKDAKSPSSLEN